VGYRVGQRPQEMARNSFSLFTRIAPFQGPALARIAQFDKRLPPSFDGNDERIRDPKGSQTAPNLCGHKCLTGALCPVYGNVARVQGQAVEPPTSVYLDWVFAVHPRITSEFGLSH
jgi:hypothetical protein